MKTIYINNIPFMIKRGSIICLEPVCLDIETSNNHAEDPAELRTWIVSIQVIFNNQYYLFRSPLELVEFYKGLYKKLNLYPTQNFKKKLISYIHNASYDLSYLIPFLNMLPDCDISNQGIIEGPNKFLSYVRGSLEFRCSYLLTGMSLEKWSKEMNIEHKKQVGLYDYEAILYPDSELTEDQDIYDKYDVLAMNECLAKQMEYHNDNLTSIPLTSTGYVRRVLRESCKKDKYYRKNYFINNRLTPELYQYCLKSYAGGMTHNNRFFKDRLIRAKRRYKYFGNEYIYVSKIGHRDFKSHYPTQMTCYKFPLGKPQLIYKHSFDYPMDIKTILSWYPNFSSISVIRFFKAELKDINISMPFMQFSKAYEASFDKKILDNGRIILASGIWIMYLDNLTLDILNKQYNLEYEVLEVYRMKNEYLPACIVSVVDRFFKGKSDKKNLVHELTEKFGKLDSRTIEADFDLMQQKKFLNSIYGCCATNPLRNQIELTENFEFRYVNTYSTIEEITEGLNKFYNNRNNYLSFIVGCFVTALARHELFEYIEAIGYKNCLYCDTDSIFYIKNRKTEKAIEDLNKEKHAKAHFVILDNGQKEYYDEFSAEPDCLAFKGLHSKCYGIVTNKGLELTIAGVPARTLVNMDNGKPIYYTREDELSGIPVYKTEKELNDIIRPDPFKSLRKLTDGFKFKINTGVSAIYIGSTGFNTLKEPIEIDINGHKVLTAGGCVIRRLESKEVHDIDYPLEYEQNIINGYNTDSLT